MDPNNAERIFWEASQIESDSEREEYLDKECAGNERLRKKVDLLLAARHDAEDFLESPPSDLANGGVTLDQPVTEKPGDMIAGYKLLQQVGEGGMGVVYMAEQKQPVKRRVALKIIKPGMDSRQVIARFEAERQALAMMDHPNIAKVLDCGTTDAGRPYFVMELVKGVPITKYCDENHLTPKERLELFIPVCQAIQHAHQKGIIHRDIKPSNILIAEYDHKAVPKIIDFGVAKALNAQLTDKTMFTQLGQIIGTIEYMSPEQAKVNQMDVDTRSDVYSLGVVLYELLTGATPFDKTRLRSAALDELMRIIREEEPPRPSTRLSTIDTLPSVAANRKIEPRKLTLLLHGELDWIVMKALEKDRGRRYDTASAFAADVQHYLDDDPVVACPPSAAYKFRKFARRNKGRLVTASLLAAALLVTVGGVGWAVRDREAQRAEVAREKTERQERVTTQVELLLGDVDRLTQDQQWDVALVAVRRADAALGGGEADSAVGQRVGTAIKELEFVVRLTEIRMETSVWKNDSFDYAGAVQSYGHAFRDFGIDVETLPVATAVAQLKQHPRVNIPVATALDDFVYARRFSKAGDDDTEWRSLVEMARGLDPDPVRNKLRSTWENKVTPELQASLRELAVSFDVRKHSPNTAVSLAYALKRSQLVELREQILRQTQQIFPGDYWVNLELGGLLTDRKQFAEAVRFHNVSVGITPASSAAHINLGYALLKQGQPDAAIAEYRTAIEIDPKNALAHINLGYGLLKQGQPDAAIDECRTAIELDPKSALAHKNLGSALHAKGELDQAIAEFRVAIELDPKDVGPHNDVGSILREQGQRDEAIDEYRKAIELDPNLALLHSNLGVVLLEQGHLNEAIAEFHKAIELDPKNAMAHNNLGNALRATRKLDEAIDEYHMAIKLDPKNASVYNNLGNALRAKRKLDEAIAEYQTAIELDPKYASAHNGLGIALMNQGRIGEAIDEYHTAIELEPKHAAAHNGLGLALATQGRIGEAIDEYHTAIELEPNHAMPHANLGIVLAIQGKLKEAIAEYRIAIELSPNDSRFYTNLVWLLATAEDPTFRNPPEAVALARKATELQPKDANHWCNLGVAEYRAGNCQESVDAFRQADVLIGGNGDRQHRFFLAMAHWQLGNQAQAHKAYEQAINWLSENNINDKEQFRFRDEAKSLLKNAPTAEKNKSDD